MDHIAESYVKLVLAVGQHDADFVDAYYGPEQWQKEAQSEKKSLESLKQSALDLSAELKKIDVAKSEEIIQLRHRYLVKQLHAIITRIDMLNGKKFSFDEEAQALYDAAPPKFPEGHFKNILKELEAMLPGKEPLLQRYDQFKREFIIPNDKLDKVFTEAIEECRKRTNQHIALPNNESFTVEYVKDKPWSGYNWYKGNSRSLIQVNTDLPIYIDRAIDLAAHEGYPGHHVYNALLEQHLVKEKNWVEFSVYPLFSPQSLIAEGSANYGVEVVFPRAERIEFERRVLFPLAGIDPKKTEKYYSVMALVNELAYAGNEAARGYLNGTLTKDQATEWLTKYSLYSPERAQQRIRFIEKYRSYVINYNLGQDLVKRYIESHGGTDKDPKKRWSEFKKLLSSPRLPSGLH
ncbi:MAG: hypothetical protein HY276_05245 [Ignavibacteriales bacterium]|nr:hypothetical protein [Ignavibacteriales bacterium]